MGFPSRRARGRITNRSVGEILVQEWKGDNIEKALLTIHPDKFNTAESVAMSMLLLVGDEMYGSRRHSGALKLGIQLNKTNGTLEYTEDERGQHAKSTLAAIIRQAGTLPQGHAEIAEPTGPSRRQSYKKYACTVCGYVIRHPENGKSGTITHDDGGTFAIQEGRRRTAQAEEVAPAPQPAPPAPAPRRAAAVSTQRENIENLGKVVEAGAARVVGPAPRAFGA